MIEEIKTSGAFRRYRCRTCKRYIRVRVSTKAPVDPKPGRELRLARRRAGMTLARLEQESGYSANAISRWELGRQELLPFVQEELLDAMDRYRRRSRKP